MLQPKTIQILLLPGLGGDHRMVHSQAALLYEVISADYIPFERGETLAEYARRFGEYLLAHKTIDLSRPLFLGGYSFGSAIAQELAKFIPCRGIILIGGLIASSELKLLPRFVGRMSKKLPLAVYRASELLFPNVMRIVSGISEEEIQLVRAMYHDLPRGFFRDGYHALAEWSDCELTVPLLRIHGEWDQIIKNPKQGNDVIIIPRTKHLAGQAQPEQVNAAIERWVIRTLALDA